jgi:hypothetical protein
VGARGSAKPVLSSEPTAAPSESPTLVSTQSASSPSLPETGALVNLPVSGVGELGVGHSEMTYGKVTC